MTLHWWMLALPVLGILVVAVLVVSIPTVRAAVANLVDSLRYE